MPITYDIDTSCGVVIATSTGTLTEAEIAEVAAKGFQDPRYEPSFRAFFDHSAVAEWKVSTAFMTRLASARKRSDSSRTAILVTQLIGFGLVRAYQSFVDNGKVRVFTNRTEALEWLNEGVPPEKHIT